MAGEKYRGMWQFALEIKRQIWECENRIDRAFQVGERPEMITIMEASLTDKG